MIELVQPFAQTGREYQVVDCLSFRRFPGLVLEGRGIMRSHQKVILELLNGEQAEGIAAMKNT